MDFKKNKSTELAVLDLQSKIVMSLEKNEYPCTIFLDFAKAFDTVNHKILINKLEYYGIRGKPLEWFKSYLSNRKQCVSINDSALGPLLFLISINDITSSSNLVDFYLFADDTSLFYSCKTKDSLQNTLNCELEKLLRWLIANKLTLNVDKSNVLLFRPKNASNELNLELEINGEKLIEKHCAKYLGIIIDNKLTFSDHISQLNQKLTKGNCLLAKLRHFVPSKILKNLYYAHIQPFLEYGTLVWSMASETNLKTVSSLQNRSIRIIHFKNKDHHVFPLYKEGKVLPLDSLIKLAHGKLLWQAKNGFLPESTVDIYLNHGVLANSRNPDKLILPYRRTDIGKSFFTFKGVKIWNNIPEHLTCCKTIKAFKTSYKEYLE